MPSFRLFAQSGPTTSQISVRRFWAQRDRLKLSNSESQNTSVLTRGNTHGGGECVPAARAGGPSFRRTLSLSSCGMSYPTDSEVVVRLGRSVTRGSGQGRSPARSSNFCVWTLGYG